MLLNVTCKKCGIRYKLDIGSKSIEEVKKQIAGVDTFDCPGHHIELSSPVNYLTFGDLEEGSALSESEWLIDLKTWGYHLISNDEIHRDYTCTGFNSGLFVGAGGSP